MEYAYYPGCSLDSTGIEFNLSTKAVAKAFGIQLVEIPDWNCCGASAAHSTSHWLGLSLPARNLAIAEAAGLDVAIPCAACYARSKRAEVEVCKSEETRAKIEEIIGRPYKGESKARALLDIFHRDLGVYTDKNALKKPLAGLKVVTYYGCLMVRPVDTGFDDPEDPISLDEIMTALGAEVVPWGFKTECCGASLTACRPEVGFPMTEKILDAAKKSGADCIVTACPMCMANLDMRQDQIGKAKNVHYDLPVYYFTELLGVALNMNNKELGIPRHFVPAEALVNKIGQAKTTEGGEA
ncbi:MAG: CoB--CoM heterodisulfide reductase iron-sulfur subunit B family protein [Peptococcaceae bacterium]|nr:CoB--CoM heterodisulfide reductase iron-sulfur subunit B family protein [Peptococcaceae bacterium]